MGTAFSSSLFGLSGSLVLGFLDLQAGQAQNMFYNDLEDWLSTVTDLDPEMIDGARRRHHRRGSPRRHRAPVARRSRKAAAAQRSAAGSTQRATTAMANLAEGIQGLVQHMRSEQQVVRSWVETQSEQQRELQALLETISPGPADRRQGGVDGRRPRAPRMSARAEYWPAFVDVLTNLLLVFIFLLSIFALVQFLPQPGDLRRGHGAQPAQRPDRRADRTARPGEGRARARSTTTSPTLQASLAAAESERDRLQRPARQPVGRGELGRRPRRRARPPSSTPRSRSASARCAGRAAQPADRRRSAARSPRSRIALDASETRDKESQTKIADLGRRLNVALAQRVQELSRYRSDFFGRLREILGDRPDIRVVGDRFVFQSEVLFATGSDEINEQGIEELDKLADAVVELDQEIPTDIPWVLQVNGHTDKRPITGTGGRFRSNWDLSAARAISVVPLPVDKGIPPEHLVAAGFGEFQPIEDGDTEEACQEPPHRAEADGAVT